MCLKLSLKRMMDKFKCHITISPYALSSYRLFYRTHTHLNRLLVCVNFYLLTGPHDIIALAVPLSAWM